MKPNIGLSDSNRDGVVKLLTPLLADEYVLYTKTRNFHWNVVGPQFNDLHKFFEGQYEELDDFVDEVAERIRQLGAPSPGTLTEFTKTSRLKEHPGQHPAAKAMITALLADHADRPACHSTLLRRQRANSSSQPPALWHEPVYDAVANRSRR